MPFLPRLRNLARKGPSGWMVIIGAITVSAIVIMTLISPYVSPYNPSAINVGPILQAPSRRFPMGTNHLGEDMLSRVLSGGATMLEVALLSMFVCMIGGIPIGLLASFKGGVTDKAASLVMDSIYAFPGLVLAIAIAAMLGPGVVNMALAIAVVYIPSYYRIVRSQVLTIKELNYVEAARSLGARTTRILRRYVFPNLLPSVVVVATINLADAIDRSRPDVRRFGVACLDAGLGMGSNLRSRALV